MLVGMNIKLSIAEILFYVNKAVGFVYSLLAEVYDLKLFL